MTNIEKVKRILDAGHWVKAIPHSGNGYKIITSYIDNQLSCIDDDIMSLCTTNKKSFDSCTIEVIQRIPTPYKTGDKVLVLSNPCPGRTNSEYVDKMVGKVCEIKNVNGYNYEVWNEDKTDYWVFQPYCLVPAFDEEEPTLSGKEAKIVIDGKEYTCVIK